jgi:hypothetical protein
MINNFLGGFGLCAGVQIALPLIRHLLTTFLQYRHVKRFVFIDSPSIMEEQQKIRI